MKCPAREAHTSEHLEQIIWASPIRLAAAGAWERREEAAYPASPRPAGAVAGAHTQTIASAVHLVLLLSYTVLLKDRVHDEERGEERLEQGAVQ